MNETINKAKEFLASKLSMLPSLDLNKCFRGASRAFILMFAILVYLPIILYLVGWIYNAIQTKKPDLEALITLINTMFSNGVIYGMGIIGLALVDKDHNGNPDVYENSLKDSTPV